MAVDLVGGIVVTPLIGANRVAASLLGSTREQFRMIIVFTMIAMTSQPIRFFTCPLVVVASQRFALDRDGALGFAVGHAIIVSVTPRLS
jgi:hypothetical protein